MKGEIYRQIFPSTERLSTVFILNPSKPEKLNVSFYDGSKFTPQESIEHFRSKTWKTMEVVITPLNELKKFLYNNKILVDIIYDKKPFDENKNEFDGHITIKFPQLTRSKVKQITLEILDFSTL